MRNDFDSLSSETDLEIVNTSRTNLEKLVLQLREANRNLIEATFGAQDLQAKAEIENLRLEKFFVLLAHELRSPLAPIGLAADLLGKIVDAHPQLPRLQGVIARQFKHLKYLVDDLADVSRISAGKISLEKRTVSLADIINNSVEISAPFIASRNQILTVNLPLEAINLNGDAVRLAQVFSNLLNNASKFTQEQGHIAISACLNDDTVTVTIKDDGMGIASEMLPLVFELFKQGPPSLDHSQQGLGVGLAIVKSIVHMHGGGVDVRSAGLGMGSEFLVTLPITGEVTSSNL
ncbi:hypothetical protein GCM10011396_00810 [Undibacterium terreum]|uniref:histidine kinase n=1 Tax=Undibacterium terreum TaxID=1224302 RepID=A0A916U352_9BURK|nr:hypothetical protein GCM10011396_00810 [Undibacterium terreum]